MEESIYRYTWKHSRKQQIWIVCVTLLAMVLIYLTFDLPKLIIDGLILGTGFEAEGATKKFFAFAFDIPWIGRVEIFEGFDLERLQLLTALSLSNLALVAIDGLVEIYIDVFKGRLGERLLRRIRCELVDRILRFPPKRFKQLGRRPVNEKTIQDVNLGRFHVFEFLAHGRSIQ